MFVLYDLPILLRSGIYSGPCTGMQEVGISPGSLSLGGIPKGYSLEPWVASEEEQKSDRNFNGKELDINLGCH